MKHGLGRAISWPKRSATILKSAAWSREKALRFGTARTAKIEDAQDERSVYALYYAFDFRVDRLRPHQILAINRGETQKVLRVALDIPERDRRNAITAVFRIDQLSPLAAQMALAIDDAAERLLLPAIERDVRRTLTEQAETHAIRVFGSNVPRPAHTATAGRTHRVGARPWLSHRLQSGGS